MKKERVGLKLQHFSGVDPEIGTLGKRFVISNDLVRQIPTFALASCGWAQEAIRLGLRRYLGRERSMHNGGKDNPDDHIDQVRAVMPHVDNAMVVNREISFYEAWTVIGAAIVHDPSNVIQASGFSLLKPSSELLYLLLRWEQSVGKDGDIRLDTGPGAGALPFAQALRAIYYLGEKDQPSASDGDPISLLPFVSPHLTALWDSILNELIISSFRYSYRYLRVEDAFTRWKALFTLVSTLRHDQYEGGQMLIQTTLANKFLELARMAGYNPKTPRIIPKKVRSIWDWLANLQTDSRFHNWGTYNLGGFVTSFRTTRDPHRHYAHIFPEEWLDLP